MITPQAHLMTAHSLHEYRNRRNGGGMYEYRFYKTYRELKKDMKNLLNECIDDDGVSVYRSRRGQWGEWFEVWKLENGEPTIVKQGWS
jgi:hypothetical protein